MKKTPNAPGGGGVEEHSHEALAQLTTLGLEGELVFHHQGSPSVGLFIVL
jgi:hypothetical protein